MQLVERRKKRSQQVVEALSYQLTHVKEKEQLEAFLLVDHDGLLIAAAPSDLDPEALSALCPLLHHGIASEEELASVLGKHSPQNVALRPLEVQQEQFFLFSVGNAEQAQRAVQQAESGVQRIFKMF